MNKNLKLREYTGEYNLHIDGRNIPYQIFTAYMYLLAKNEEWTDKEVDNFIEENYEEYILINQIIGLKQSCVLLRNTSYSCGSLSDHLYELKLRLIHELRENYKHDFDEDLMERYPERS